MPGKLTFARTPVRVSAELWKFGVTPEEIATHLPHLTLAQIFDALSYYQDHREEIDADIVRNRVPEEWFDVLTTNGKTP